MAVASLAAYPAHAQPPDFQARWSGFWTVRFERAPSGSELIAQLPDNVVLIDDAGRAARYLVWSKCPGEYVLPYDCDPNYGV
jgi:hypothetical protein